jgi:hypothetical protein
LKWSENSDEICYNEQEDLFDDLLFSLAHFLDI